jgi:PEP-CTERM motif
VKLAKFLGVAAIALGAAAAGFMPSAHATTFDLFNTGVDGLGAPRSDGSSPDLHYTLTDTSNGGAITTIVGTSAGGFPINGAWLADNSTSAWIAPLIPNAGRFGGVNGATYDYRTTFDLTGFNPATASISGQWSTDDTGLNILINGGSTGQTTPGSSFGSFTDFIITSGFIPGINTLDFLVSNLDADCCSYPTGFNPTGLRVELTGTADLATPLPATWTMMLAGLAVFGFAACRRKKQTTSLAAA